MNQTSSAQQQPSPKDRDIGRMISASIHRYEAILHLFEGLANRTDKDPAILSAKGAEILLLQENAAQADEELLETLRYLAGTLTVFSPLLTKRQELMQAILNQNQNFQATLQGIKSFLAHEIKEIQGGRTALNGYHRQATSSTNGGIINGAL